MTIAQLSQTGSLQQLEQWLANQTELALETNTINPEVVDHYCSIQQGCGCTISKRGCIMCTVLNRAGNLKRLSTDKVLGRAGLKKDNYERTAGRIYQLDCHEASPPNLDDEMLQEVKVWHHLTQNKVAACAEYKGSCYCRGRIVHLLVNDACPVITNRRLPLKELIYQLRMTAHRLYGAGLDMTNLHATNLVIYAKPKNFVINKQRVTHKFNVKLKSVRGLRLLSETQATGARNAYFRQLPKAELIEVVAARLFYQLTQLMPNLLMCDSWDQCWTPESSALVRNYLTQRCTEPPISARLVEC